MRALVAVVLGGLGVVFIVAGVNGSAENLFTSLLGVTPSGTKITPKAGAGSGGGSSTLPGLGPNQDMPRFPGGRSIGGPIA